MAGFNLPITVYTPQQLDQLARAAFKAPALMGMGGGGGGGGMGGGGAAAPGFDAAAASDAALGIGKLGAGLFNRDVSSVTPTAGTSLGGGEGGGMTTVGPGGVYSVTGVGGDFSGGGASFGGGMADGGPVMPGQYYTVGERGPETFVPATPGYIVPNDPRRAVRPAEMPSDPFSAVRRSEMPGMSDEEIARLLRGMMSDPNSAPFPDQGSAVRSSEMPSVERDFFGGRRRR